MPSIEKKETLPEEVKIVNFIDPKEILFPKICIACGKVAEHQYKKIILGMFKADRDYKQNYSLNLPICFECSENLKMPTGYSSKSGKLLFFSTLIGLPLGISLYFVFYSLFLSISLIAISIVLPFLNYKVKMRKKIKLDDFIKIRLDDNKKLLTFNFFNANYANFIRELNLKKESEEFSLEV